MSGFLCDCILPPSKLTSREKFSSLVYLIPKDYNGSFIFRVNFHYYLKPNDFHLILTITGKNVGMMWLIHFIQIRIPLKVCSLYLLHESGKGLLSIYWESSIYQSWCEAQGK